MVHGGGDRHTVGEVVMEVVVECPGIVEGEGERMDC